MMNRLAMRQRVLVDYAGRLIVYWFREATEAKSISQLVESLHFDPAFSKEP